MKKLEFCLSREKHLDHMVKVVPFIVFAYAIQCYFIMKFGPEGFALNGLFFLGGCLISMISAFAIYDLTHLVTFEENALTISIKWLNYVQTYHYSELTTIEVSDIGQPFATIRFTTDSGKKFGFYFVDDADKIKSWIEQKRLPEMQSAA